jgi:predicted transcriptional regulator
MEYSGGERMQSEFKVVMFYSSYFNKNHQNIYIYISNMDIKASFHFTESGL